MAYFACLKTQSPFEYICNHDGHDGSVEDIAYFFKYYCIATWRKRGDVKCWEIDA